MHLKIVNENAENKKKITINNWYNAYRWMWMCVFLWLKIEQYDCWFDMWDNTKIKINLEKKKAKTKREKYLFFVRKQWQIHQVRLKCKSIISLSTLNVVHQRQWTPTGFPAIQQIILQLLPLHLIIHHP